MEAPREESPRGIFASIRALVDSGLAVLHRRADLFTTEVEEEITRLVGVLIWSVVGVQCAIIGVTFVAVTVLLAVPSGYRALTAGAIAILFLGVATAGALFIRKIVRAKPRPFDASLSELAKDRERLKGKS